MEGFQSPADVAAMYSSSESSADTDKLDRSVIDYHRDDSDEDFDIIDDPPSRPSSGRQLYPGKEVVEELRPEEIRWFYKNELSKKWIAFIGYDSLRIECRHRALNLNSRVDDDIDEDEKILVRGGLYEVDVKLKKCSPVYWIEDDLPIMRGIWFEEGIWQPLEESYTVRIEEGHMTKFKGMKLESVPTDTLKGPKPVIHNIQFKDFHVDWNSTDEIYKFNESTSSKLFRNVRQTLGWQKSGTRLRRGYVKEAVMDDKPPDVCHLVFVIHGIGQLMDTTGIARVTKDIRDRVKHLRAKMFPDFDQTSHRAEFLPVQWRSNLQLDQGTVESVTPNKMRGLRNILNSSALDVLYYTSPLYRYEITSTLKKELIRLYQMFCARHPYFEASNGKVSIIAHSLGTVITYDIITGWSPVSQYHQWMNSLLSEEEAAANERASDTDNGSNKLKESIENAKSKVSSLDSVMKNLQERQGTDKQLPFSVENIFNLGSPLAVFLALRGIRPENLGSQEHILSKSLCKRLFNIFHPSDAVAYRLEPLILKHYTTIKPLEIHHFSAPKKEPYSKIPRKAYAAFTGAIEDITHKHKESDKTEAVGGSSSQEKFSLAGWFKRKDKDSQEKLSAELKTRSSPERSRTPESKTYTNEKNLDQTELEWRLDFQLREQRMESSYLSVLTSHTSYWTNKDLAYFLLIHLHSELQHLQGKCEHNVPKSDPSKPDFTKPGQSKAGKFDKHLIKKLGTPI